MLDCCHHGLPDRLGHAWHAHEHPDLQAKTRPTYLKKLQIVLGLAALYLVIQVIGSFYSGSLALLAEAGHKLMDMMSISLSLVAAWVAYWAVSKRKTFGYHRLEILAALVNSLVLIGTACFILGEAAMRMAHHEGLAIDGRIMFGVACFGLVINAVAVWVLFPDRHLSLNVKSSLWHVVGDVADSIGTMVSGAFVFYLHWMWVDTLMSILIAGLILFNACRIFREAMRILMEAAPRRLNLDAVETTLKSHPGVLDVHDLHIWTITTGRDALLAHVKVSQDAFRDEVARALEGTLRKRYDLCHITLQMEPPDFIEEVIPF